MEENKMEIIYAMKDILDKTRCFNGLIIKTGYLDYSKPCGLDRMAEMFVESEEKVTHLLFLWAGQNKVYGHVQSIEGDSGYGIMIDIMKALERM